MAAQPNGSTRFVFGCAGLTGLAFGCTGVVFGYAGFAFGCAAFAFGGMGLAFVGEALDVNSMWELLLRTLPGSLLKNRFLLRLDSAWHAFIFVTFPGKAGWQNW